MGTTGESRHLARARALELYYEATMKERSFQEIVASLAIAPDPYTVQLLHAIDERLDWAEDLLEGHSHDWSLDRMPLLDRLIMTLALCELASPASPGRAVVFDEAVEFARTYSTDASSSFVNGLLTACADDVNF
jgi:transcription antitermination protein NusB